MSNPPLSSFQQPQPSPNASALQQLAQPMEVDDSNATQLNRDSAVDISRNMHITRPISQSQIDALRTGSHIQPGASLGDFFKDLENFTPVIPDAVALYYMEKNGIDNPDVRIVRLFSLAAQKFIADIALDAMQQARIKGLGQVRKSGTRFTLTKELLDGVLAEYGMEMNTPSYYQ